MDNYFISKYFDGSITEEELIILSRWIGESEENRQEFLAYYRIWNFLNFKKIGGVIDVECELEISRRNIRRRERVKKESQGEGAGVQRAAVRRTLLYSLTAACGIFALLLIMDRHHVFDPAPNRGIMSFADTDSLIDFSFGEIRLILGENREIGFEKEDVNIQYRSDSIRTDRSRNISKDQSSTVNQLIIPCGKRSTVTFSDGTKVWVNARTRLVYPVEFGKREREIYVDGQIFLDVSKDVNRPFIVKTKNIDIIVLGTKLNITAYSNEPDRQIVLVSGKVDIENKATNKRTTLTPNKIYTYDTSDPEENVGDVKDTDLYTSWIHGLYIFDKEQLKNVFKRLSVYYGVQIECETRAGAYSCSGKLRLSDDFDAALEGLGSSLPISYTKDNDIYVIKLQDKDI